MTNGEQKPPEKYNSDAFNDSLDAAGRLLGEYPSPPSLAEVESFVRSLPIDAAGTHERELDEASRIKLEELLVRYGLLARPVDEHTRRAMVNAAKRLIGNGHAEQFLASRKFIQSNPPAFHRIGLMYAKEPLYFDPNRIQGAGTLQSWLGRGVGGKEVIDRTTGQTSLEKIYDYATRETAVPPIEVAILLDHNGTPTVFAHDEHRAAAAKLRNEPVAVNWVNFGKTEK